MAKSGEGNWHISKTAGGKMSKTRPVFLRGEAVLVPAGNVVCCFSLRTGLLQYTYVHKASLAFLYLLSADKVNQPWETKNDRRCRCAEAE